MRDLVCDLLQLPDRDYTEIVRSVVPSGGDCHVIVQQRGKETRYRLSQVVLRELASGVSSDGGYEVSSARTVFIQGFVQGTDSCITSSRED